MMVKVRSVKPGDANDILKIYNFYISNSIVTFDENKKTLDDIKIKISTITALYPWYILEINGSVVGFAYASQWKNKSAYNKSVEGTVYVKNGFHGKGYGLMLYNNLIEELKKQKFHSILGLISLPNDESVALHEKLNFEKVAHFREIGKKFDKYIDVGCWQLIL
ncbi:MAG: N-acetyltransferase family protein [Bacteroidota bacterium]